MATNIGTAYVQIAPSTKGLSGKINSFFQRQGANAGNALGKNAGGGFLKSGFAGAVGGAFALAVSKGVSTVTSAFDSAASRYDTLNNFPKVMQNLGIEGDKANAAMKKLDKGISGLPTTMDGAASGVKSITAATGDVDKATDIFLALNNAILAGGEPMETQSTAMQQFTQAFSKGKPDMMEWKALQQAMPGQLNQIATAMGYGSNGATKLGEDLRNGVIPMSDFTNSLIELNTKGTEGFPAFAEQAKSATGGLQTSISVMKTAVVRGVADMMKSYDTAAANNGLPTMAEAISIATGKINSAFKTAGTAISNVFSFIKNNETVLKTLAVTIGTAATAWKLLTVSLAAQKWISTTLAIAGNTTALLTNTTTTNTATVAQKALALVINGAKWLGAAAQMAAYTIATKAMTAATKAMAIAQRIFNIALNANPIIKIVSIIALVVGALIVFFTKTETGRRIFTSFGNTIKAVIEKVKGFFEGFKKKTSEVISGVANFFKKLPGRILSALLSLPGRIIGFYAQMGKWILKGIGSLAGIGKSILEGVWNGIKNLGSWLWDKIQVLGGTVIKILKKALGIASPSKYTTYFGEMLDKGLIKGMESLKGKVMSAATDVSDAALSGMAIDPADLNGDILNQEKSLLSGFSHSAAVDFNAASNMQLSSAASKDNEIAEALLQVRATMAEVRDDLKGLKVVFNNREVGRMVNAVT